MPQRPARVLCTRPAHNRQLSVRYLYAMPAGPGPVYPAG